MEHKMFLKLSKIIKNNQGDTIVEVLIAVTVLMVIISGGYAITTRSLNGVRISQERSEATKIAEGQIEAISQRINSSGVTLGGLRDDTPRGIFVGYDSSWNSFSPPPTADRQFCVDSSTGEGVEPGTRTPDPCLIDDRYKISISTGIETVNFGATPIVQKHQLTYTVTVSWDKLGGSTQKEEVKMLSRYTL